MIIGTPKEIKNNEYRVSVTPGGAYELVKSGHKVLVQSGAGDGSGHSDKEYVKAGAKICSTIEEVYKLSEMIVKVKEPIQPEYSLIRKDQIIFTYLHLSSNKKLVEALLKSGSICIAYETIEKDGHFPLLAPMSEVAGRVAAIVGAYYLGINFGGNGVLVSGVSGVLPGYVLILGAGVVAKSAAKMASGLGAKVTIMSPFIDELREIEMENYFGHNVSTLIMSSYSITEEIKKADILISAVYIRGARTPILVTKDMVKMMKKGSVHKDPVYIREGVLHYCVANMPGVFSKTSTLALTNLTLPYIKKIADYGTGVFKKDKEILSGLNICRGRIACRKVAEDVGMENMCKEYR